MVGTPAITYTFSITYPGAPEIGFSIKSAFSGILDWARFIDIAKSVDAYLLADISGMFKMVLPLNGYKID